MNDGHTNVLPADAYKAMPDIRRDEARRTQPGPNAQNQVWCFDDLAHLPGPVIAAVIKGNASLWKGRGK